MRKPVALRAFLLANVPALAADPSRLDLYIDKGRVACRSTGSLAYQYAYTLNIVVQDFAGDLDQLVTPLLVWIAGNEPELLAREPSEPFAFEAEILDGDSADVSFDLELTERVLLTAGADGSCTATHLPDAPVLDQFGQDLPARLRALQLHDDLTGASTALSA